MNRLPLDGVRIVDFSRVFAMPLATMLLSTLGAEIVLIESRKKISHTRVRNAEGFSEINFNKLSVTLDLSRPEGVDLAKRLVATADAVTENFSPGVMQRLGLGYAALREIKPDIVMVACSGFGATGPEKGFRAFASVFAAMAGFSYISGYADGIPTEFRGSADFRAGQFCAVALLGALFHRRKTGRGQYVDVSCTEALACLIGDVIAGYAISHREPRRQGNRDDFMAPCGCYRCRGENAWVSITVANDAEWSALCGATGHPEWRERAEFADQRNRWLNQDELDTMLTDWTASRTDYEVTGILQGAGVAAFPSISAPEIFSDAHLADRGFMRPMTHPDFGERRIMGPPWQLSGTPAVIARHSPLIGEHNDHVFGNMLGISAAEIARLKDEEVIA